MDASQIFTKHLFKLGAKVRTLQDYANDCDVKTLEKEINTCEAFLIKLYECSTKYSINIGDYYYPLMDIHSRLIQLNNLLEKKKTPWWKKALYALAKVINIFTNSFGIGSLLPTKPKPAGLLLSWTG